MRPLYIQLNRDGKVAVGDMLTQIQARFGQLPKEEFAALTQTKVQKNGTEYIRIAMPEPEPTEHYLGRVRREFLQDLEAKYTARKMPMPDISVDRKGKFINKKVHEMFTGYELFYSTRVITGQVDARNRRGPVGEFIIAGLNEQLRPVFSKIPYRHKTRRGAHDEANRLAELYNKDFAVFHCVRVFSPKAVVEAPTIDEIDEIPQAVYDSTEEGARRLERRTARVTPAVQFNFDITGDKTATRCRLCIHYVVGLYKNINVSGWLVTPYRSVGHGWHTLLESGKLFSDRAAAEQYSRALKAKMCGLMIDSEELNKGYTVFTLQQEMAKLAAERGE